MKKKFTILIAAIMLLTMIAIPGKVWAEDVEVTYDFTNNDNYSINTTNKTITYDDGTVEATFTYSVTGTDNCQKQNGIQWGSGQKNAGTITINTSVYNTYVIIQVDICATSTTDYNATVSVGETSYTAAEGNSAFSSTAHTNTYTGNSSGNTQIVLSQSSTKKNVVVKSITITYTTGGGTTTDPTITFSNGSVDVGNTLDLSTLFSSNSEGTVTYSITAGDDYATLDNSTLTGVAAGSVTVQASQEAAGDFNAKSVTATITVNAIPYTVTLGDNSSTLTETSAGAGVTLPTRSTLNGYAFAGWSETNVTTETTTAPTIIAAGEYHPTANITLYPVYTKTVGGGGTSHETASVSISDYATANNWVNGNNSGPQYTEVVLNADVKATTTAGGNNGKYYNDWRFYTTNSGNIIITTTRGELTSVTFTFTNANNGVLSYGNTSVSSGNSVNVTGTNAEFTVSGSSKAAGQIKITAISVNYDVTGSSTTYYWSTPEAPAVEMPVITIAETPFLFSTTVTITCATDGATIKYSYDGETWSDYPNAGLTITETKTIYAKGVKDQDESQVVQATATKQLAEPTVTIVTSGITNKNVYSGTAAGSLSATVTYNEVAIGGASVTWEGDDDDVATITSAGVVTLVAAGSVTFTATYAGNTDYSSKTATYTMVVINVDPSAPSYTLVTSTSQIIPGAHYVLSSSKTKDATAYIMDEQSGTYRLTETATILEDNEDGRIYIQKSSLYEFVISGFTDNYTIYDETNGTPGYLYHTSDKSVGVTNTLSNSGKWKITFDNDKAIINNFGSQSYYLEFNTSANPKRVTDYAGTQPDGYLYIKDSDPDIHPYSSSEYTSGSVTINDAITLSENYNITVGAGATLIFTKTPSCSNASWLVIEDGGQLIISSTGSKTGVKATFQKEITAYTEEDGKDNYYLIANPTTDVIDPATVAGMVKDDVDDEDEFDYDLYYFDEAQPKAEWRNYRQGGGFNLVNGKGYLYAKSSDITLEFPGTVLPGTTATIELSKKGSGTYAGFNLVGNPLSNNVTSMMFTEADDCSYYKLNSSTGIFETSTDPIIVGEAFMVQAQNDKDVLTLNPSVAKGEDGFNNEVIRLEVSNSKYTDVAFVYFGYHLPLTKINHLNDEAPMLYIHNENSDRAVEVYNNRGEVKSINVNFEAKTMGTYTISAKMVKGEIKYMHLYDRLTGIDTDLLVDDYSFIGTKDDQPGRFILNLESVDDNGSSTGSETFAYQSGDNIIVNGEGELQVFDVTGRMVMSQRVNGAQIVNGLNTGVYVFRMEGKVQKVVIR